MSRKNEKILKQAADILDILYIGETNSQDMIKGLTFSPDMKDEHFMHGNINGFELSFITRASTFPEHNSSHIDQEWLLMRVELPVSCIGHFYLNRHRYPRAFYRHIQLTIPQMKPLSLIAASTNVLFAHNYSVFGDTRNFVKPDDLFNDQLLQHLATAQINLDYEIKDSFLYSTVPIFEFTAEDVQSMADMTIWMAGILESKLSYLQG